MNDDLLSEALSHWGFSLSQVVVRERRRRSNIFSLQRDGICQLLKARPCDESRKRLLTTFDLHVLASLHGLAPRLALSTEGSTYFYSHGYLWTLCEKIRDFSGLRKKEQQLKWIYECGALLGRLHALFSENIVECKASFLQLPKRRKNQTLPFLFCSHRDPAVVASLNSSLKYKNCLKKLTWQWVHGDFSSQNILCLGEQKSHSLCLIDFDNASFFPRVYEVIRGFFAIRGVGQSNLLRDWREFIFAYLENSDLTIYERTYGMESYCWIAAHNLAFHASRSRHRVTLYDEEVARRVHTITLSIHSLKKILKDKT